MRTSAPPSFTRCTCFHAEIFAEVHGDILSGIYDHYLDPGKRCALGEVFKRPEIARYIMRGANTTQPKLCSTGHARPVPFLVEALNQDVTRLRSAGMLTEQTVTRTLQRLPGLHRPFCDIQQWKELEYLRVYVPAVYESLDRGVVAQTRAE